MAKALGFTPVFLCRPSNRLKIINSTSKISNNCKTNTSKIGTKKRCLRCSTIYRDEDNSPTACSYHGHTSTGEKGLYALAPPHQGIDGEWSDRSGVIVYRWNKKNERPNTGSGNWKKRWSCCQEYDRDATPCRKGWHVSYDDGFTLYYQFDIDHAFLLSFFRYRSIELAYIRCSRVKSLPSVCAFGIFMYIRVKTNRGFCSIRPKCPDSEIIILT